MPLSNVESLTGWGPSAPGFRVLSASNSLFIAEINATTRIRIAGSFGPDAYTGSYAAPQTGTIASIAIETTTVAGGPVVETRSYTGSFPTLQQLFRETIYPLDGIRSAIWPNPQLSPAPLAVIVATPTEFRWLNLDGTQTIVKGRGFTYDASNFVTGGTATAIGLAHVGGAMAVAPSPFTKAELGGTYEVSVAQLQAALFDDVLVHSFYGRLLGGAVTYSGPTGANASVGYVASVFGGGRIEGSADADVITGFGFGDVISGLGGNDTLKGGAGKDSLSGGSGNDVLIGGAGHDTLDGGAGTDLADYSDEVLALAVNLLIGVAVEGAGSVDTLVSIENVRGGAGDDFLLGNDLPNALYGNAGNDNLWGFGGADTLHGGDGDDILVGGAGDDVLYGGNGKDWLYGQDGSDVLYALANAPGGFNVLVGGNGNDTLEGASSGFDYFYGGDGASGGGNDTMIVRAGTGIKVMNDFGLDGVRDVVRLIGTGFTSFAEVQAAMSFSGTINGTVLVVDAATQIWFLNGLQPSQFTANDFQFG